MSYKNPDVAYNGLFSSSFDGTDGVITTASSPQDIDIKDADGNLVQGGTIAIEFITDCGFNFDDDAGFHFFPAGTKIDMARNSFDKLRVETSGTQIRFWGMSI